MDKLKMVDKMQYTISINKKSVSFNSLSNYSTDVIMPAGWKNYDN